MTTVYRMGTRKSKLAQIQADQVAKYIYSHFPDIKIEKVLITTEGDRNQKDSLLKIGGQGVFVNEIRHRLLDRSIDFCVHSAKDLPSELPSQLTHAAYLPREDVRDVLVTADTIETIDQLPNQAKIGTSSKRRLFEWQSVYPQFYYESIRGNVDTRLNKVVTKEYDATILAMAGLNRLEVSLSDLGLKAHVVEAQKPFIPAVGQGVIAVECLRTNQPLIDCLSKIDDSITRMAITQEREYLAEFGAGCNVPIGAYAEIVNQQLKFQSIVFNEQSGTVNYHNESFDLSPSIGKKIARKQKEWLENDK